MKFYNVTRDDTENWTAQFKSKYDAQWEAERYNKFAIKKKTGENYIVREVEIETEEEKTERELKESISTLEHHKEILTSAIEKVVYDIWDGQEPTRESEILRNALIKVYQL